MLLQSISTEYKMYLQEEIKIMKKNDKKSPVSIENCSEKNKQHDIFHGNSYKLQLYYFISGKRELRKKHWKQLMCNTIRK